MMTADERAEITAARKGDRAQFDRLARRHRGALIAHAYRMLGSVSEAEDAVQETLLRSWKSLATFEERSSFKSWLYKIATNCCLDALASRKNRVLTIGEPSDPASAPQAPAGEVAWLEPIPDSMLEDAQDPEARASQREQISLAFLCALQLLPPQQRAALLLTEVLGFSAAEAAETLELSVAALNSSLQRARATLADRDKKAPQKHDDNLLRKYVGAWQAFDLGALVTLLREDAQLTMPPSPTWIRGREAIVAFYRMLLGPIGKAMRLVPVRANGCPAFLVEAGGQRIALQVLELEDGLVTRIDTFTEPSILARF